MAQASLIGLIGVVLGSAKSIFAKIAYEIHADPVSVLFLRMILSLPFLLIIGFLFERKQKNISKISRKDIVVIVLLSIFGYYLSSLLDFMGLLYVDAEIERLILFTYPTMIILISAIFLKKSIRPRQVSAIVVSYFGILISFGNNLLISGSDKFWIGVILVFISALIYAIFLIMSENIIARVGSSRFTTIATLTMCVCMIIHAGFTGKADVTAMNGEVIWICTLMALLSTIAPIYMFNYAMDKIGITNISILACLGPVCTLILSALMLSEKITTWEIVGTFVVMAGILLISFEKIKKDSLSYYLKKSYAMLLTRDKAKTIEKDG